MILVDTSVWIDHLRQSDAGLKEVLVIGQVVIHPFSNGELALGNLRQRKIILDDLSNLPQAIMANDQEMLQFIERHALSGLEIGYVDVHLLASARLGGTALWTHDKRLHKAAIGLGLAYNRSAN